LPATVTKVWQLREPQPEKAQHLSRELRISAVVAQLLINRGLERPDQARRFLDTSLSGLHPPELLPGVRDAADRIWQAVQDDRKICIYGDYDVDGVTGTAILYRLLKLMNAQVRIKVPLRLEEGYGLNIPALESLAADGVSVVVTVDCGIASVVEAEAARQLGLELIVTDHHEFKEQLPAAAVLVHPRLPGTDYPFGGLCGSAVAFKLAWALAQRACGSKRVTSRYKEFLLDAVALSSLGIVADVVPLHDENRILVRHGLSRLRQAPSIGLKALCGAAGLTEGAIIRSSDIGFKLAPRLNAAGRLGCAQMVVDLLSTARPETANELARVLEAQNTCRQLMEREITRAAQRMLELAPLDDMPALVLASSDWHPGIIGIVASRLVEAYGRPTLMIALRPEDEAGGELIGHGSGRSIPGLPLNEALHACRQELLSFGAHKAAAGFRIRADRIDAFREAFCDHVSRYFPQGPPEPVLLLDAEVPLLSLTVRVVEDLDRLEPYGADNPKPVFLAGDVQVDGERRKVGKGELHLSFFVRQGGVRLKAIAFGMANRADELMSAGGSCCLAFTPKINEWMGRKTVNLEVIDWQPGPRAKLGVIPAATRSMATPPG